jgi:protein-tyrosine phosphatase
MFRNVELPRSIAGKLLLHSMPGRREPLESVWQQVREEAVGRIVCLTGTDEIKSKSPAYAQSLEGGTTPCPVVMYAMSDYGVPTDVDSFWALACDIARDLRTGARVLIHCAAGIGRTGTLATSVLIALGMDEDSACAMVMCAGSCPETESQCGVVAWCAEQPKNLRQHADRTT